MIQQDWETLQRKYSHNLWLWTIRAKCSVSRTLLSLLRVVSRFSFLKVLYVAASTGSVPFTFPWRTENRD